MKQLPKIEYKPVSYTDRRFLLMLAGDWASGKTTIAASAQKHEALRNVLFIKVEDGIVSADHVTGIIDAGSPTPLHVRAVVNDLLKPPHARPEHLREIRTVVVDSVSKLKDRTLNMLATEAAERGKREESYINEIQDWGRSTVYIAGMIDEIIQTDMNVILIAGVDEVQKNGVTVEIKPLLNAKLTKALAHMMHNVWYTKEVDGRYAIKILPGGPYRVKNRNPFFQENLKSIANDQGWFVIPDSPEQPGYDFPTLPYLYDLYLNSKPE